MEMLLFTLVLALTLTIMALAVMHYMIVSSNNRAAHEKQTRKSCEEQANLDSKEKAALQAKLASSERDNASLKRERSTLLARERETTARCADHQRDSVRQRRRAEKAEVAAFSNITVENAHRVKEQWQCVSDIFTRAGLSVTSTEEVRIAVEKLQKPALSSPVPALSPPVLSTEPEELTNEKAAKEAAQSEAAAAKASEHNEQIRSRLLEIELQELRQTLSGKDCEITSLGNQLSLANTKIGEITSAGVEASSSAVHKLQQDLSGKDRQIATMDDDLTVANTKIEKITAAGLETSTSLSEARTMMSQAEQTYNEAVGTIEAMKAEGQALLVSRDQLQVDLGVAQADLGVAQAARDQLEIDLDVARQQIAIATMPASSADDSSTQPAAPAQGNTDPVAFTAGEASTSTLAEPTYDECETLVQGFDNQLTGVDRGDLTQIITDKCENLRGKPEGAEITIEELPLHVVHLLLAYIEEKKKSRPIAPLKRKAKK